MAMRDHRDTMEPYEPSDASYDWDYDGEPAEHNPSTILWGRVAVLGAAILVAFLIGRLTAGGGVPEEDLAQAREQRDAAQAQVTQLEGQVADLQADLDAAENATETPGAGEETPPADEEQDQGNGAAGDFTTYTVQSGDTLRDIAEEVYCDATAFEGIAEANPNDVGPPPNYIVSVGDELVVPNNPDVDQC
jgi:nucleoid-associated protein YgaU